MKFIVAKICSAKWAELRQNYIYIQSKPLLSEEDRFYSSSMAFLAPYMAKKITPLE